MARDLSTIIVLDLEATCWENQKPPNPASEIIEIGIATLIQRDGEWEIGERESIVVKPEHGEISEYCTNLTGWTQEQIDREGMSFAEAITILREKYRSRDRLWGSYGAYDARAIMRECEQKGFPYPFGLFHINIKALVEFRFGQTLGMDRALKAMKMPLLGRHHSGVDDALNTAELLKQLIPATLGVSDAA